MKCPFCKKRIPKNVEVCMNCGKTRQEIFEEQSNRLSKKVTNITLVVILAFCLAFASFGFYIRYSRPRLGTERTYTSYETVLKRYPDILNIDNVKPLIDYRDDLKDILNRLGYQNIQVIENVKIDDLRLNTATLTMSASVNDMQIKMTFTADKSSDINKSFSVAGSGFNEERHFEIKEDDIKDIFNYLEFDEGYQLLIDGYQKMSQVENNKYQYLNNDNYNIALKNEIYNSTYQYSYMISK